MVEELSLSDRLLLLKRLMGLRMAQFRVSVDEHDQITVHAASLDDSDLPVQASEADSIESEADSNMFLHFKGRSFRVPELSAPSADRERYFG